jgi:hypothetical protein
MVSFWTELLKNTPEEERTRKDFRLPVIIPLVLYNGLKPWTVEPDFVRVCESGDLFGDYALNFKYYLIDVNRQAPEDLLKLDNLIAAVFFIDQDRGETPLSQFGRIQQVLPQVGGWPERDGRLFLKWLKDVALPRVTNEELLERVRADLDNLNENMEVSMFVSNFAVNLEKAVKEFAQTRNELVGTRNELVGTRNELAGTKAELAGTRNELAGTRNELAAARAEIEYLKRGR